MTDKFSLPKHFAQIITGPHNQHVSMLTVGRTGAGKSNANLRFGYAIACEVAKIKGGKWQDYFNIDHIAVITRDEILRVMKIDKKYAVIMLDDIGVGLSARGWQKEENKLLNEIIQTFRTDNTCLLLTLPNSFMLDKIPRNLSHWFMEMEMGIFEKNLSIAKIFEITQKPRKGKVYHQYHQHGGRKIIRTTFSLAPDDIRIPYEKKRLEIAKQLKQDSMDRYLELIDKMEADKNGTNGHGKQSFKELHGDEIYQRVEFEGETKANLADEYEVSLPTITTAFKHGLKRYKSQFTHQQQQAIRA